MATKSNLPENVANWDPKMPSGSIESMLEPNAKDNPDSLTPENKQAITPGKSGGKMPDSELGQRGRAF